MKQIDIEKLNQLISRTDISGNDKVRWLTDFIDGREFQLAQEKSYSEEEVRKISLDFFYHWWNSKGTNTEEGFDKWFKQFKKK